MGYNTTVVVMVDALDQIEADPKFGKNLVAAIMSTVNEKPGDRLADVRAGNHINAATVIESHHADQLVPVLVGGNTGRVMSDAWIGYASGDEAALRNIAERMGYRLVKKEKGKR